MIAEDSETQKSKLLPKHSCKASLSNGHGNEKGITAEKSENCSHANASVIEGLSLEWWLSPCWPPITYRIFFFF